METAKMHHYKKKWIKKMWYLYTMEYYLSTKKTIYSPSNVDYRPKTNAVILLDMGHTLKGDFT
jgi:hypothetical protein